MKLNNFLATAGLVFGFTDWVPSVRAQVTEVFGTAPNVSILDNNLAGVSSSQLINSSILSITDVDVHVTITGGWNGDLFLYLVHNGGFSVLLNRPGRTAADGFGYSDAGFNIDFDDAAANGDVHYYRTVLNPAGSFLTGVWAPDARTSVPSATVDIAPRSAFLSAFNGQDPDGTWTVFAADLSPGGISTLSDWSLRITGVVPETSGVYGGVAVGLLGLAMWFRRSARRTWSV